MTTLDYTELFARERPHLWVRPDLTLNPASPWRWRIENMRDGKLYCPASTLDAAERFMRAAEKNGDATVDEVSISYARTIIYMLEEHSVRMPSSEGGPTADADSPELPVPPTVNESATPSDPFSNVVPIRGRVA